MACVVGVGRGSSSAWCAAPRGGGQGQRAARPARPPARQAAILGRHDDAFGPEISGGVAREARGRSTAQRRAAAAGTAGGQHRQAKGTRRWGNGAATSPAGCCPCPSRWCCWPGDRRGSRKGGARPFNGPTPGCWGGHCRRPAPTDKGHAAVGERRRHEPGRLLS